MKTRTFRATQGDIAGKLVTATEVENVGVYTNPVEGTKNGVTRSTVFRSDDDRDTVWEKLWSMFQGYQSWCYGNMMVRQPDIIQLFEIPNDAEAAVAANKATA
jgi:hypothetical protein